ncbi:MAG: exodeoxyribonuclease VII small subunit [Planctomycetes bacterium]|nr:exodeoxyribonuclease VII small subunit [Planctomycetota bacterium]
MEKSQKKDGAGNISFEQAIKALTQIVSKIETGEIALQDSLEQYEKGMALIKYCREVLSKAEKRIEKISASETKEQGTDEELF